MTRDREHVRMRCPACGDVAWYGKSVADHARIVCSGGHTRARGEHAPTAREPVDERGATERVDWDAEE